MAEYGIKEMFGLEHLKEVATEVLPAVGGFAGAGVIGRQIQNRIKPDSAVVGLTDGIYAWGGNNVPKLIAWLLLRGRAAPGSALEIANLGIVTSVGFDTLMRLLNSGKNPATATIMGWQVLGEPGAGGPGEVALAGASAADIQRLMQENGALRVELNKAMQQLQVAGIQVLPDPEARRRRYGAMEPEIALEIPRQKKFGIMGDQGAMSDLTARFGML